MSNPDIGTSDNEHLEHADAHHGPSPKDLYQAASVSRRVLAKVAGAVGVFALADSISGGKLSGLLTNDHHEEGHGATELHASESPEDNLAAEAILADELTAEAHRLEEQIDREHPELTPIEKARMLCDGMGCFLFASGIWNLLPMSEGTHITSLQYGFLGLLTAMKHTIETPEARHHLEAETVSSAKAFAIISGTIVVAEGITTDVEAAYEEIMKEKPELKDQIAAMCMLSSVISPLATTVGSASIVRRMSNDLAEYQDDNGERQVDADIAAVCVSHISNLSGYLLFGDPPFIAVAEKYGFAEGVAWQMKTMWPLALYSLASSMVKLNYLALKKEGVENPMKEAIANSAAGVAKNIPFLAKMIAKSLTNSAKYFSGLDSKYAQDPAGLEVYIGEVLLDKLGSILQLPFDESFDITHPGEEHEGLIRPDAEKIAGGHELAAGFLANALEAKASVEGHEAFDKAEAISQLREALDHQNWSRVRELGEMLDLPMDVFIHTLIDFEDNARVDDSDDPNHVPSKKEWGDLLNPVNMWHRAFSMNRIPNALGHNLGDVVNVFPFQAGCVPFLLPAFNGAVNKLDELGFDEKQKEIAIFMMVMVFSMFADNYVGCKVGLDLLPDKPQIALIAAIQGGSMSAIGNMANIAQFNLDDFPLMTSFAKMKWHIDNAALGLIWSQVLGILSDTPLFRVPDVVQQSGHASVRPEHQQNKTRGSLLGIDAIRSAFA